ncbi:hypothetical protein SAMD00023353_7000010 [Rosellinia necatrix]|uniref:Uncharacterized protein n=1 Tax=Rosellinia necatrix TaxID=77044 RepID=A0A1W2TJZ3_ROSNE|nr:hypothetical protein SAMD00023353_7000010 [Rosellinia necatrix]
MSGDIAFGKRGSRWLTEDFRWFMTQLELTVKAKGPKRLDAFYKAVIKKFSQAVDKLLRTPKRNSLQLFSWRLYKDLSDNFSPKSARSRDQPLGAYKGSRPFVNITMFEGLDTGAISFKDLVDFIMNNGNTSFRWPRKSRQQRMLQQGMKRDSTQAQENQPKPITRAPPPTLSPYSASTQDTSKVPTPSSLNTPIHTGVVPPTCNIRDSDDEMTEVSLLQEACVTSITKPPIPILSFSCRMGWDLNNTTTWMPAAGCEHSSYVMTCNAVSTPTLTTVQPSTLGTVSFTAASQEDIKAFLGKFIGNARATTEESKETKQSV